MRPHRSARFLAFAAVVMIGVLAFAMPALAAGRMPTTDIPIDGTDLVKNMPVPKQVDLDLVNSGELADYEAMLWNGRTPDFVLNLYDMSSEPQGAHLTPFWKEASGDHSDIYVAWLDLESAPDSVQKAQAITPADIAYMAEEFDARIWASDVFHFGNYDARPAGTEEGKRAGIFVYNIRDDAFWTEYRYYIAGYFASGLNDELDLNAIFIDSYDWANRTRGDSARPYLYEGTIAHEFQHLIHNDVDGNEDSFVDEGMADLAEQFIYGTQTTSSHIGEYLYFHRDSLIDWKGELFDYGNAVLWTDYLFERAGGGVLRSADPDPLAGRVAEAFAGDKFADSNAKFTDPGDKFIWDLIHDQDNGLGSIANQVGGWDALEQLHRDYTLANLLDGKVSAATYPQWNYHNLELGGADSDYYRIEDGVAYYSSNVSGNMPPTRKNVRRNTGVEAWGAYYRTFTGSEPGYWMHFYGKLSDGVPPASLPYAWYGGLGNMLDSKLTRTVTGVPAGSTLTFKTWFDIEPDWDYGYVEASSDEGVTWHVLPQISTLQAGVTDVNGSTAWKGPGGFTGSSGGWSSASFDLSGHEGTVRIRFRYVTDEAANGQGWYVDDIAIGTALVDPVESFAGWTADPAGGWMFTTGMQHNDWTADSVGLYQKARGSAAYEVRSIGLTSDGAVMSGSVYVPARYLKSGKTWGVVSNRPRDGIFASATGNRLWISKTRK